MPPEPATKRAVAFVDGQNLFFAARQAFGYTYPNYDFPALAAAVCAANGWSLQQARFYTGIPDATDDPFWNYFWAGKLRTLSRQGVEVFSRSLRYRNKIVKLPNGTTHAFLTAEEKGIDVRIAIDVTCHDHVGHPRTDAAFGDAELPSVGLRIPRQHTG